MSPWPELDALLTRAACGVRLLAAVTPTNAVDERRRLILAARAGAPLEPRWEYARPKDDEIARALEVAAEQTQKRLPKALAKLYLARIVELDLERRIAHAAGNTSLAALSLERFGGAGGDALVIAKRWARAPVVRSLEPLVPTDSHEPSSLLSMMRAAVTRLGIDFRVVVHASLASLAATGERTLYVSANRATTASVARRTVVHETLAHALPRCRARDQPLGVFSFGSARGQDDQEGYALMIECSHRLLDSSRMRELGARHLAVRAMRDGAAFHEVVTSLRALDHTADDAVVIAERVFRGGSATRAGLGREAIYLASYARVREAAEKDPSILDVLSAGQVSVLAAPLLGKVMVPASTRPSRVLRRSV